MKKLVLRQALVSVGLTAFAAAALGQELRPAPGFWVRTGAVIRSGYNVQFTDSSAALPTGSGNYANGFVRPSVSTNSPYTWNWGYQDASQVQGTTVAYERFDSRPRVGALESGTQSSFGGELRAGFEAFRFEVFDRDVRFGLEAGYSYSSLSASASGSVTGNASYTRGVYSLIGPGGTPIIPPTAPYSGTFGGPGPVITLAPVSINTLTGAGTSTVQFGLDADIHTFKLGPYFEMPLSRRWVVGLSFGYCTVLPDSEFTIDEMTSYPGTDIPGSTVKKTIRRSDWQPGGYAELRVNFEINRRVGVYVAGEFQYNEDLEFGGEGRTARVDLGGIYGASAGIRLSF